MAVEFAETDENVIRELIKKCRYFKKEVKAKTDNLNDLKHQLRMFMIDSGIETLEGVNIKRSHTAFDLELLRLEKPELFERYAVREEHTITTFENTISKDKLALLEKEHPELWNDPDYRKERTPALYGL